MADCVKEEWRPFRGGTYEASSLGRIRRAVAGRTTGISGRIMTQHACSSGYKVVRIRVNGKTRTTSAHYVIAEAFLGTRPIGMVTNHLDHDRGNNAPNNLEYVSQRDNLLYSSRELAEGAAKLTTGQVLEIRRRVESGEKQTSVARDFRIHKSNVSCIVRRTTWTHI